MDTIIALLHVAEPLLATILGAGGTMQFFLSRHDKKVAEKEAAEAKRREAREQERLKEKSEERERQEAIEKEQRLVRDLVCAIAQDRIVFLCDRAIKEGEIEMDQKDIIDSISKPYEELGWNNHAHGRLEAMRQLPKVVKED